MKAFERWWATQGAGSEPIPKFVRAAFEAGVREGQKEAERDARDVAAEAGWKERQGEEYGSY
jgi:hypothetical protein